MRPLLNDRNRNVVFNLKQEEREQFSVLKSALLQADDASNRDAGQSFWTTANIKGTSIREYAWKILHNTKRMAHGKSMDEIWELVAVQHVLQELPKDSRMYIHDKDPKMILELCTLSEKHFRDKEQDLDIMGQLLVSRHFQSRRFTGEEKEVETARHSTQAGE